MSGEGREPVRWLLWVATAVYALGVLLLALAVRVEPPGFLAAYGEPDAGWPIAVNVLAGVVAVGAWRYRNRRARRAPLAVVMLGLGILTVLVLASASYSRCPDPGLSGGWSVVTRVVGLLTNNYAVDMFAPTACDYGGVPLALQFARLVQLAVVLVAATSALAALLGGQLDRLGVRVARRVSIAAGVDQDSVRLLPGLARNTVGTVQAVLVRDPQAAWVGEARASGWKVVVGDLTDRRLLDQLLSRPGGRHALRDLYVFATPETVAFEQMTMALEAVGDRSAAEPIRVLLRSDNRWQAELLRQRSLGYSDRVVIDTVGRFDTAAQQVVDDVTERGCDLLVLHGRSEMTSALLDELAQQGTERVLLSRAPEPRVLVTGPHAEAVVAEHRVVSERFGRASIHVDVDPRDDLPAVLDSAGAGSTGPALVFTGAPDEDDQRAAAVLKAGRPQWEVYVPYAETAVRGIKQTPGDVLAYGIGLVAEGVSVGRWERLARAVHEEYVSRFPDSGDPARRPWDQLSDFYRESNIRQVTTTISAATAVGLRWSTTGTERVEPGDERLDRMARLEHESWFHFMRSRGWRHGATRDRRRRRHPDLLPYDGLPEASRAKVRVGVTSSLELLASLGYRTVEGEGPSGWVRFRRRGEVTAVRRDEPWSWSTSGGTVMQGQAGDWEVTDGAGASRSVAPTIFERTHEHVDGDRWRRVGELRGRPARPGEDVHSLEGDQRATAGQWVLRGVEDEEWLISAEQLEATYDRVAP